MKELELASGTIRTEKAAFVMGIVNCTPDSFFEKSRMNVSGALQLIEEGADILDIGGESTRPGSSYVDCDEEIKRILPVIKEVRKHSKIPISVDTRKFEVMKAAFDEGADILNDVSALEDDFRLADFAAKTKIPVILMHKRGLPQNMQNHTEYKNAFNEVDSYLASRVRAALDAGISENKIIIDPGIGFGKNLEANKILISRCGELLGGKFPVLMALSRKSCIGEMTGRSVENREAGTLTANLLSVLKGASLLRVHDVASCVDSLSVLKSFSDSSLCSEVKSWIL